MKRPNIKDLTLREKIGQILMVQQDALLRKTEADARTPREHAEVIELMKKYQYGSIWGSGNIDMRNANMAEETIGEKPKITAYGRWFREIDSAMKIPMLLGMDCETGGGNLFPDATLTSSALAIGACNDEELSFQLGAAIARELKVAGCNWRWSPILDIPNRLAGVSVGRSFSDNSASLAKLAIAHMKGMQSEGTAATAKHFPGCDPYEVRDTHIVTATINLSLEEWERTQGKPFQAMIDAGVWTVMIGHMAFPAVDDRTLNGRVLPATLSDKIINGLLRERMGFDGVVITDAITMGGITSMCPYDEMLIRAINAGNDIILGVNIHDFDTVYAAVERGDIPMNRIDESCERVLALKEKVGLFDGKKEIPDIEVETARTREIDRKISEKAVTLVCDNKNTLPFSKENIKNVAIIVSSHFSETIKQIEVMKSEFEKRGASVSIFEDIEDKTTIMQLADTKDLIIYAGYIAPHRPMGMPSFYGPKMMTYYNAFTYGKEKSIGASMGYPYLYHDAMNGADIFFNIYSPAPNSMISFVKTIYGELPTNTYSPVDLEMKLRYIYC